MALHYAGNLNAYLPQLNGVVVAYVRKPSAFSINKYVQYVPTDREVFAYAKLGVDENVHVPSIDMTVFTDGEEAPRGERNKHRFDFIEAHTERRAEAWTLGHLAIRQAGFRLKQVHMDDAITKTMIKRTLRTINLLETPGTWGSNTASATALGGSTWDGASDDPNAPGGKYEVIYNTLTEAAVRIHLATNGVVKMHNLQVILSPRAAIKTAKQPEIIQYMRESPEAERIVVEGLGGEWGLPKKYKGFNFVVEDTPYVTEMPKASGTEATTNRLYLKSDTTAILTYRQGGLDGEYGSKSYSTVQIYHYGALLGVKVEDDSYNQRIKGYVEENIGPVVPAPQSGFLVTGIY